MPFRAELSCLSRNIELPSGISRYIFAYDHARERLPRALAIALKPLETHDTLHSLACLIDRSVNGFAYRTVFQFASSEFSGVFMLGLGFVMFSVAARINLLFHSEARGRFVSTKQSHSVQQLIRFSSIFSGPFRLLRSVS